MVGVVFGVHVYYQGLIDHQSRRNDFLQAEIDKLDKKIAEIRELEAKKASLIARMEIIQQLQSSRPEIVHLMDEFVTTLPEGVFYTNIQQKGRVVNMEGIAQSNARVSSLMRRLEGSPWLRDPNLLEIKAEKASKDQPVRMSTFKLVIKQNEQKKRAAEGADKSTANTSGEKGRKS